MRRRFTILFWLMVAVPLGLLAWLGGMMAREESVRVQEAWLAGLTRSADVVDDALRQEMSRLGTDLDALLQGTSVEEEELRELPREQPLVRHAFLLDVRSNLLFPQSDGSAGGEAEAFLRRTGPVWESGVRLGVSGVQTQLAQAEGASSAMRQPWATYVRGREGRPLVKGESVKSLPPPRESGWHVWYYGSGPQMLFWQQRQDGRVVGVELEMAALLSLLVNRLDVVAPDGPGEFWRVAGLDGTQVVHQWGGPAVVGAVAALRRACPAPLGMWQVEVFPGAGGVPRGNPAGVWLGAAGAALALALLAWLVHREGTREMREARRRVSFVNQVSHELKTPLTNIRLYAEMAQEQARAAGEEKVVRHLEVVEAETSRLGRLIHNVLTFARQQREQLVVNPQPVVPDELLARVMEVWRPGLAAKGFKVVTVAGAPERRLMDPDAVEQMLGNLLSNVEKYAASGSWVKVATVQDAVETRLEVEDRGPGVPTAKQQAVFEPFVRLRQDLSEGVSGTGIGLAITRELARLHGGSVCLDAECRTGARFVIRLPAKQVSPIRPTHKQEQ